MRFDLSNKTEIRIHCLWIGVDYDGHTYNGTYCHDEDGELFRCFTGQFHADYCTIYRKAMQIRHGRVLCLEDSIFEFRALTKKHHLKRTKFPGGSHNGKKSIEREEVIEIGDGTFSPCCDEITTGSLFESQDEGDEEGY